MEFLKEELELVKTAYTKVEGTILMSCVPELVQIKITRTKHKELVVNFHFPDGYPQQPIVLELRSKVMSEHLLGGLVRVAEDEARKMVGEQQVMQMTKFIRRFIDDNPLCVCSDEITRIKRTILAPSDEIKLKQKTSQVVMKLAESQYFLTAILTVPDEYPVVQLGIEVKNHSFPDNLSTNFLTQAVEIARKYVEPPLKQKPKAPPFEPKPSLAAVVEYFVKLVRNFPNEKCPVCKEHALPRNPKDLKRNTKDALYVERMYCDHLYHRGCVDSYMKTPPFTGGKKCPACGNRIFHEKWKLPPEVAEARWAHKEARKRELDEVVEFLE